MTENNRNPLLHKILVAIVAIIIAISGGTIYSNTQEGDNPSQEATTAAAISEQSSGQQWQFRNESLLEQHYEKHGKEMGFSSAEEYEEAASAVVNNENALHKTEKEDGDDVYYLEDTNEFVIVSTDGYLRTYFYPNDGIKYYNRQ
jgi:pyocin large subunit-like protein